MSNESYYGEWIMGMRTFNDREEGRDDQINNSHLSFGGLNGKQRAIVNVRFYFPTS